MIYALLNAASSVVSKITPSPTATLLPTATVTVTPTAIPIPIPTVSIPPLDVSIVNGNGWEIAGVVIAFFGVIATFILGIAALRANNKANEIAQKQMKNEEDMRSLDLKMTQQQNEREEKMRSLDTKISNQQNEFERDMRQREAKIAVMDKAFEIYNYFTKEITDKDYFIPYENYEWGDKCHRLDEIEYRCKFMFKKETFDAINIEITRIGLTFAGRCLPKILDVKRKYTTFQDVASEFSELYEILHYPEDEFKERRDTMLHVIRINIEKAFEEYKLGL